MKRKTNALNWFVIVTMFCTVCFAAAAAESTKEENAGREETAAKEKAWAEKVDWEGAPENLYQVSEELFRSGQPEEKEYQILEDNGIQTVLNLRAHHENPEDPSKDYTLIFLAVPMNAGSLTETNLLDAFRAFQAAKKPLLVHCWHGSDRTGAFCAAYRIVAQNWTVEEAIDEMVRGPYGFHKRIYGNVPKLLRTIDWEKFKTKLLEKQEENQTEMKSEEQ